jgi:septal ring-binding cell division protein DamX
VSRCCSLCSPHAAYSTWLSKHYFSFLSLPSSCRVAQHVLQELFPQSNADPTADPASQQQQQQPGTGPAARRFKGLLRQATPSPACSELVASEEFHLPLVECAVQLVAFIAGEVSQVVLLNGGAGSMLVQEHFCCRSLRQAATPVFTSGHECFAATLSSAEQASSGVCMAGSCCPASSFACAVS